MVREDDIRQPARPLVEGRSVGSGDAGESRWRKYAGESAEMPGVQGSAEMLAVRGNAAVTGV